MRKLLQGHLDHAPGEAEGADAAAAAARPAAGDDLWRAPGLRASRRESPTAEPAGRALLLGAPRRPHRGRSTKRCSSCLAIPGPMCPRQAVGRSRGRGPTPSTRRAAAGEPVPDESVVVRRQGRGAASRGPARGDAQGGREAPAATPVQRLQPGEKKHAKPCWPPSTRSRRSCAPGGFPPEPGPDSRPPRPRPRPRIGPDRAVRPRRGSASLDEPAEVVAEAMLEAERSSAGSSRRRRRDATRSKRAPPPTAAVILDIVVEYVWKAAHVFHDEGSPELASGRGRACGTFSRARPAGWRRRCCGDRRRLSSTRARTTC